MRSFVLGSVAAMAAFSIAGAAELPSVKAKPAEQARTCMIGDAKGFLLPGSDTCVKLGGFISVGGTFGNSRPQGAWTGQ